MRRQYLFLLSVFFFIQVTAQEKKSMDHNVYEGWNEIREIKISNNGIYITYEVNPQQGDGRLELYNTKKSAGLSFPRACQAEFSNENLFLAARIKPPYQLIRKEKLDKKKKDELSRDSLLVYVFDTGRKEVFENVRNFSVPEKGGQWMVYHQEYIPDPEDKDSNDAEDGAGKKEIDRKFRKIAKENKLGDLVILNPVKKLSFRYENVKSYAVAENGSRIIFHQMARDSVLNSVVYVFDTGEENLEIIFEGEGRVENLSVDKQGKQSAFTFSADTARITGLDLYFHEAGLEKSYILTDSTGMGLSEGQGVSKFGKIYFSGDGSRLFFGSSAITPPEPEDTLLKEEKPSVDVWSWHDQQLQPMQKKRLKGEQERSFLNLYYPGSKEFVALGDELVRNVTTMDKGNGQVMMGTAEEHYGKLISWEGLAYRDVYTIDPVNGEKEMVLKKLSGNVDLSPAGKYIIYWMREDSTWYCYDIANRSIANLTSEIPQNFYDEMNDIPQAPGSYGYAGFTKADKYLLIYDRYDIWKTDPSGKEEAQCLTKGEGRKNSTSYRYINLDREKKFIDMEEEMFLNAFNEKTREDGIAVLDTDSGKAPVMLVRSAHNYGGLMKAKDKDVYIFRKEDFRNYPDIYLTRKDLKNPVRISEANPQAADYLWGDVSLVSWTSFNGDKLDGILYVPENLDKTRKYPMLVYFYERSSDGIYRHRIPSASRSIISIPWCTSNGYVVFVPDIVYRDGYPGASAYDAIVSGTQSLIDHYSFIDSENIGIQGQSWGGYQVAYLVTRTNMYKAAMAGAPVSNMTSAYGGIRWGSGMSRMFQYEKTQSRIGATLWEQEDLYIENSPVFHAPRVETPLLIMHNDNDGAVPWYQGIELFVALRRLDKPVWMLTYNDEEHNLTRWPNRIDLSIRMMQFFDYYLKGEAEPGWMKEGVLQINKGKKDGFLLVD